MAGTVVHNLWASVQAYFTDELRIYSTFHPIINYQMFCENGHFLC